MLLIIQAAKVIKKLEYLKSDFWGLESKISKIHTRGFREHKNT